MRTATFINLFTYDQWATDLTVEAVEAVPEAPERAIHLLGHQIATKDVWLTRIRTGDSSHLEIFPKWTMEKVREEKGRIDMLWTMAMTEFDSESLMRTVEYKDSGGKAFINTYWEILMHVINHGTYHRAQIASVLREVGAEPPKTDYIYFSRNPVGE